MKKIHYLFLVILSTVVHISVATKPSWGTTPDWLSKEFVFINRAPNEIKMWLSNASNPVGLLFPNHMAKIILQPNESRRIKLPLCLNQIAIYLGPGGMFAGGISSGNYAYPWSRFPGRCSGVAEITKKNDRYRVRWLK